MEPLFELGQIVITPNAAAALESVGTLTKTLLRSHVRGEWGSIAQSAKDANNRAVKHGFEAIHSVYELGNDIKVWVITRWDHEVTTILLPSDY